MKHPFLQLVKKTLLKNSIQPQIRRLINEYIIENEIEEKSPSIDGEDQMSIKSSSELAPLKNTAQFSGKPLAYVHHSKLSSWENGSGKMYST